MTENERELLEAMVPFMQKVPERMDRILAQILLVRRAYEGQNVALSEYVANLERELEQLEHEGRHGAQLTSYLHGILDEKRFEDLVQVHRFIGDRLREGQDG